MTRVLAIHNVGEEVAEPMNGDSLKPIARHIEYKKGLDYYCIIKKTMDSDPKQAFSPAPNMEVIPTNSTNRYEFMWQAYRKACRIIEEKNIDVLTGWDWIWAGAIQLALRKKYNIPVNIQIHWEFINNPYFKKECFEYRIWDAVGRYIVPRADTIFVGTSKQRKDLIEYGIDAERVFYIPYTANVDRFEKGDAAVLKEEMKKKGFNNILLWVGRREKQKDPVTMLEAMAKVVETKPETVIIFLGLEPENKNVIQKAHELKISKNVIIHSPLPQQECINYYHAADVLCVSSLYEGTCMVYLEAMAASKPIVTTDVAGAFDAVIEEKTGYIVPKRDSLCFAKSILKLLNNPSLSREMGHEGKRLLQKQFRMQRHYDGFIHMWNETKRLGIKKR